MGLEQIKVDLIDSWQTDKAIAHAAWASSIDKEKLEIKSLEDIKRVIKTVISNHHDTPKESVWFSFFITCPIFVERQLDKYRITQQYQDFKLEYEAGDFGRWGITQNELSGRYRTIPERFMEVPVDVQEIMSKAKFGGFGEGNWDGQTWYSLLKEQYEFYQNRLQYLKEAKEAGKLTNNEYKRAREFLRGALGTAYLTDMRIVCNGNAFEHIINQRLAPEAQLESRVVAFLMFKSVEASNSVPNMLFNMVETNGWKPWLKEVEGLLEKDVQDLPEVAEVEDSGSAESCSQSSDSDKC